MPLKNWHGHPQPAPVLWRDADSKWADAVLSEGEVAVLSGPGGIGKSYLALSWALAATRKATGSYGENCGLRVRRGPVAILSYDDAPVRIAGRIADQSGGPAPDNLYVLERPAPMSRQSEQPRDPGRPNLREVQAR